METSNERNAKKYIWMACLSVVLTVVIILAFNSIVDPYGMYRLIEIKGFNSYKPSIYTRVRLYKTYEIRRIKPQAIVLGTSRSHVGLRMSHEGWSPDAKPGYNIGFDGATTKEMYFFLRHADAVHPLKQVVLGLDSYHPTIWPAETKPDFDPQLFLENRSIAAYFRLAMSDLKILSSVDTVSASVQTIRSQNFGLPEWFAADGRRIGEVFFRQIDLRFSKSPRAYFDEIDREGIPYKIGGSCPTILKNAGFIQEKNAGIDETSLGYIRRILEYSRARHIDLRIFITPEHAHQIEITSAIGGLQSIETAKRDLVKIVDEEAAGHPGEAPFPVYDFGGYNSITTENLPAPDSKEEMKYYWESSHFKEIVGDYVLDRIFGINRPEHPVPEDFGVKLTKETVEPIISKLERDQIVYQRDHPGEIAAIRGFVVSYCRKQYGARESSGLFVNIRYLPAPTKETSWKKTKIS